MGGLREALDDIVADVPVYGDLDLAIATAERVRRQRLGALAGLAAAAVVLAVLAGAVAVARSSDSAPPVTPVTPRPTPERSQGPETWVDAPIDAEAGYSWDVPDPLEAERDAWFAVVADHLDPAGAGLEEVESSSFGLTFRRPVAGSIHTADGRIGLAVDGPDTDPLDGCRFLDRGPVPSDGTTSCSDERFTGPHGEPARIARWGRRCGAYEGGGPAPADCGDYKVAVAVERDDDRVGYVLVEGRGLPESVPFSRDAMAAAAADPRLTLPEAAYATPSDQTLAAVVADHFPRYRSDPQVGSVMPHPGLAQTWGTLGRLWFNVQVLPRGGAPSCGRSYLVDCVERRVYGADDPTTVFVGAWDEEDWAGCCPRNSRADSRVFVHVGPRHTVVVSEGRPVRADEPVLSAGLDQRMIALALDARLQGAPDR